MRKFFFIALFGCVFTGLKAQDEVMGWQRPVTRLDMPSPSSSTNSTGKNDAGVVFEGVFAAQARDSLTTVPVADEVTAEIQSVADALARDPLKIYEWVRNSIDFVPYNGLKRGAHLTLVEKAGNDFDTCALLVALLKASGYSPSYRFGNVWVITESADKAAIPIDAETWLSAEKETMFQLLVSTGMDYEAYRVEEASDKSRIRVPHIWVEVNIGGSVKVLDPSFKAYRKRAPVDLATVAGFSKAELMAAAGGSQGDHATSWQMNGEQLDALRAKLTAYTTALVREARTNLHHLSAADIAGQPSIVAEYLSALPTSLPPAMAQDGSIETWTQMPADYCVIFAVTVDNSFSRAFFTAQLQGKKLSLLFNAGKPQFWLEDEIVAESPYTPGSGLAPIRYSYLFPNRNFDVERPGAALDRSGKYVILYGFDRSLGRLKERLQKQSQYVAEGVESTSREMVTENLYISSLQYINQSDIFYSLLGNTGGWKNFCGAMAGVAGQTKGPFIDIPLILEMMGPRKEQSPSFDTFFLANTYWGSTMEHVTIEQMVDQPAVSTVKLIEQAVKNGDPIYLAKDHAQFQAVKPLLLNPSAFPDMTSIENAIRDRGGRILLPKNVGMNVNSYRGVGYMLGIPVPNGFSMKMGITGGYSGGFLSVPNNLASTSFYLNSFGAPTFQTKTPPSWSYDFVGDPVDPTNGSFFSEKMDLKLGSGESPFGLAMARQYTTVRRHYDPVGLGRGWTHGYNMQLKLRHPNDFDLSRASIAEVAPLLIAAKAIMEISNYEGSANEWILPALVASWAGEQMVNSRASIVMGQKNVEFTKLPDGTYAPPVGATASLMKLGDGQGHVLQFRKGNRVYFRESDGRFTSIVDSNNPDDFPNTLIATYVDNGGKDMVDKLTDAHGRWLKFHYDGSHRLAQVEDSTGRSVYYAKDGAGNFVATDAEGKKSTYVVDQRDRIVALRDPLGRTLVTSIYDQWDRVVEQRIEGDNARLWTYGFAPGLTRETDPLGYSTWTYFDEQGRKTLKIDELGHRTEWGYDGSDRQTFIITPKGDVTQLSYDANHEPVVVVNPKNDRQVIIPESEDSSTPRQVTSFGGLKTSTSFYPYHKVKEVVAPGDLKTTFTYDARGRPKTAHLPSHEDGKFITYEYDDTPGYTRRVTISYPDGTSEASYFDARGDLIQGIDRAGRKTTSEYNKRQQVTMVARWPGTYALGSEPGGEPPTGSIITRIVYDDAGNVDYTVDARGKKADVEYDAQGNVVEVAGPDGLVLSTNVYDKRNLVESSIDVFGSATTFTYDAAKRLKETVDPLNRTTRFIYDANGRTTDVTTPGSQTTTTAFDEMGQTSTKRDAVLKESLFTYDKDGRTLSWLNRRGNRYRWSYDDANRRASFTSPELRTTTTERNERGLVSKITHPSGITEVLAFDAEGRPLKQRVRGVEASFTYWPDGALKTVTENGVTTVREYDDFGRLKKYDDGLGHTLRYEYDPAGNLTKLTYPDNTAVTYKYDDYNRMSEVTDWLNRKTVYSYDVASRITRILRPNGTARSFIYDPAGQVRQIEEREQDGDLIWYQAFKYDQEGRISSDVVHPAPRPFSLPATLATYDKDNRLVTSGGNTVFHDDNGNMTFGPSPASDTFQDYGYDAHNRLSSVGTIGSGTTYTYNPDGLRVSVGSTSFVVDPNGMSRVLVRHSPAGTTKYVWGLGLIYEATGDEIRTYHYNMQGSTIALLDGSGNNITDRFEYSSYGAATYRSGTTDTPFRLNAAFGVMTDSNGLVYMRARYYNPRTMRFMNADPIGFAGGTNLYAFAGNNPLSFLDPLGTDYDTIERVWASVSGGAMGGALVGGMVGFFAGGPVGAVVGAYYGGMSGATSGAIRGFLSDRRDNPQDLFNSSALDGAIFAPLAAAAPAVAAAERAFVEAGMAARHSGRIYYVGENALDLAKSMASETGYKTIYDTWYGKIGEKITPYLSQKRSRQMWDVLSSWFARGTKETDEVFVAWGRYHDKAANTKLFQMKTDTKATWRRIEYPILESKHIDYAPVFTD